MLYAIGGFYLGVCFDWFWAAVFIAADDGDDRSGLDAAVS